MGLSTIFSQLSGLIVTFGARMLSILHDVVAGVFGRMFSAKVIELADWPKTPDCPFFGQDCVGQGQLEL
jgi:hypothetical protein